MADTGARRALLAVHAHPDDECITTGGILARYSAAGVRTVVVTCTGGECGEISDPAIATPATLPAVRRRELAEALRILGVSRGVGLGYRDSGMAGTPDNDRPNSFIGADLDEATGRLLAVIRDERPEVLVTYDERGGYGHPDHVKAHQIALAAFVAAGDVERFPAAGAPWPVPKLYYVAFPRVWVDRFVGALRAAGIDAPYTAPAGTDGGGQVSAFGHPDEWATTAVDVAAFADQRRAALAAHRSQLGPDHFLLRAPRAVLRDIWSREYFHRAAGPAEAVSAPETDLFAGLPFAPPA